MEKQFKVVVGVITQGINIIGLDDGEKIKDVLLIELITYLVIER